MYLPYIQAESSMIDKTSTADHPGFDYGQALAQPDAKRAIHSIVVAGQVAYSDHAVEELENDALTTVDVVNVLRGGIVDPAEWENGSWRYRVRTQRMCVVVVIRSETELKVITAWRFRS